MLLSYLSAIADAAQSVAASSYQVSGRDFVARVAFPDNKKWQDGIAKVAVRTVALAQRLGSVGYHPQSGLFHVNVGWDRT